jgi:hypothetical protein
MTEKKKMIRGCHVTESQYCRMLEAQRVHDYDCQNAFATYSVACDEAQHVLDAEWEAVCKENQR